ncbi:hypothetical protein EC968_009969 [Mortierella alpina]|nr:hypothetical protein EC968_009969 [Mortierella alpina]
MHIASGIIAMFVLAAGVSAQFPSVDKHGSLWKAPNGLRMYPCISGCPKPDMICRKHGFATQIRACGGDFDWQYCKGFCVNKGAWADEEAMRP